MCQSLGGPGHPSLLPPAVAHVPAVLVASSICEVLLPTGVSVPRLPLPGTAVWSEEPGVGLGLELLEVLGLGFGAELRWG